VALLDDRKIIITGDADAGGLARRIATSAADHGARVALIHHGVAPATAGVDARALPMIDCDFDAHRICAEAMSEAGACLGEVEVWINACCRLDAPIYGEDRVRPRGPVSLWTRRRVRHLAGAIVPQLVKSSAATILHVAAIASAEIRAMLREVAALQARELAGEGIRVATALAADPSPPDARIEPATAVDAADVSEAARIDAVAGLAVLLASPLAANSAPVTVDLPPVDPSAVGAAVTRKRRRSR
jgi:hypothetical protein